MHVAKITLGYKKLGGKMTSTTVFENRFLKCIGLYFYGNSEIDSVLLFQTNSPTDESTALWFYSAWFTFWQTEIDF